MNVALKFTGKVKGWDDDTEQLENGVLRHKTAEPGEAAWLNNQEEKPAVLVFSCPCGCKELIHVPIKENHGGQGWEWNRNLEKPTTRPSIQKITGCRWHGYLTDGILTPC